MKKLKDTKKKIFLEIYIKKFSSTRYRKANKRTYFLQKKFY